jgi:predicted ATPase
MARNANTAAEEPVRHLRLRGRGPLREAILLDLGAINVVCGRNNSGKSTLLRAIMGNDKAKRSVGKCITRALQQHFTTVARNHNTFGWRGHPAEQHLDRAFAEKLAVIAKSRRVWFASDDAEFVDRLMTSCDEQPMNRYTLSKGGFDAAFLQLFSEQFRPLFVPPKRNLDTSKPISLGSPADGSGAGVTDALFHWKTQLSTSAARKRYESLLDSFRHVTSGYTFDIVTDTKNNVHVHFSRDGSSWLAAADCGLGLQDVLIILFCALLPNHEAVLVEEPENHLHPDMQRRLLAHLRSIADRQFFLSTHSNVFLDSTLIDRVFFTAFDGEITISDATGRAEILGDLGYSVTDNLLSDLVILVEGVTDVPVVEEFLRKKGLYNSYSIKTWPLNGDQMAQLDLKVLTEPYRVIALVDRDPGSKVVRDKFEQNCNAAGIPVHRLERNSIENYFTVRALREVLREPIPDKLSKIHPNVSIVKQLGFSPKKWNRRIAETMSLDDVRDTDFYGFLEAVERMLA